jgi:hypothetical protein
MNKLKYILFSTALAYLFSGCEKDRLRLPVTSGVAMNAAYVKVMYYSPTPNYDFVLKIDTAKVGKTFFYSLVSPADGSTYYSVPGGNVTGKFVWPFTGTSQDSLVHFTFTHNLEAGKFYSILVADTGIKARTIPLEDDLTLPAENKAKVRFVNAMYTIPAVDVKLADGTVLAENVAFGTASNYVELNTAQMYNIRYLNPGTNTQLTGTNVNTFKSDLLPGNKRIYTVVLRGIPGAPTPQPQPLVTLLTNR